MPSITQSVYGPIEEVRAGVDWISCTLHSEAKNRWVWANECVGVVLDVAKQGFDVRESGLQGYRGIAVGGCFAGDREDGSYLQLSGAHAQTYLSRVLRSDLHVSRIDLAVTCRFAVMPKQLGADAQNVASKAGESSRDGSRARKVYFMSGSDGGYTLYIGSPSSAQRGRLYNKEVQSDTPDYERCWRYEVVYKNALAMAILREVSKMQDEQISAYCARNVEQWYLLRGVSCPWATVRNDYVLPVIKTPPSDAAKKLRWLETQVRPAIYWLCEHGYGNDAADALGVVNLSLNDTTQRNEAGKE